VNDDTFDFTNLVAGRIVVQRTTTVAQLYTAVVDALENLVHMSTPMPFRHRDVSPGTPDDCVLEAEVWTQLLFVNGAKLTGGRIYRRGTNERMA